jgi:peptidoglycan/xylan/chitin deacetylase (PgdA/CDA1 family)
MAQRNPEDGMMRMRLPGWRRVRQAGRRLRGRWSTHVVILGYHKVGHDASDPFNLSVTPSELETHLGFLARNARVVPLQIAAEEIAQDAIIPRTVVITFDDGYDDTFSTAWPLLKRYEVPATLFLTTGNPGEPFWWDALAAFVLKAPQLPPSLSVKLAGGERAFSTQDRGRLLQQLAALLRPLEAEERRIVLSALAAQTTYEEDLTLARALRADEIVHLSGDPLIEIGAHTETHPVLADLPAERQRAEVESNCRTLHALTGRPIRSFSYPNGSFSRVTQRVVRDAGFTVACGSVPDVATASSDLLALPRLWVDGHHKRDFVPWIRRWLGVR